MTTRRGRRPVLLALVATVLAGCSAAPPAGTATPAQQTGPSPTQRTGPARASSTAPTASTRTAPPRAEHTRHPAKPTPSQHPGRSRAPATVPPRDITLAAVGDVLVHPRVRQEAHRGGTRYDFRPMLHRVAPLLSRADVALCHLETPVSSDDRHFGDPDHLVYSAPSQITGALARAGVDGCSTASNHVWDEGLPGIRATNRALRTSGLNRAGAGATAGATRPARYRVGDVTIAQLSYSYTIFNTLDGSDAVPAQAPWLRHLLWRVRGAAGIEHDARRARRHGADLVVVSIHWGHEYQRATTPAQRRLARRLLSSGAVDLVLGSHAHVVQTCARIGGRHVVYGMGNFLSDQSAATLGPDRAATQDGVVALVTFHRHRDGSFTQELRMVPTLVTLPGHVVRRAGPTSYPASFHRTLRAVRSRSCDASVAGAAG